MLENSFQVLVAGGRWHVTRGISRGVLKMDWIRWLSKKDFFFFLVLDEYKLLSS